VWRLLFAGRMDRLKGGSELLQALPEVRRRLGGRLEIAFAGDGPARPAWEAEALALGLTEPDIHVTFRGRLDSDALDTLYSNSDLLVLPSLWPEPLALVGLEAGRHGLPTVAFDVGGIGEWLKPGLNGMLAPGDPPTVPGLADAIVSVLKDPETYERFRHGAEDATAEFTIEEHLRRLMRVFETVVHPDAA
jgi:glycosyltransferase involved in cell wall biosynthesis